MTFAYRHRKQIILSVSLFVVLSVILFFLLCYPSFRKKTKVTETPLVLTGKQKEKEEKPKETEIYMQIDIKGEVKKPGIYAVKEGSRVIDVIRLAGDLTETADTSVLNLSKKVKDEMVIIIYSRDQVANFTITKDLEQHVQEKCQQPHDNDSIKNDACMQENSSVVTAMESISINKASQEELMSLPGIGEAKAQAIINYREEHGAFKTIEEIKNVSGIGEEIFAKIKESITL